MAKTKRLISVRAGRLGKILLYSQATAADDPKTRAEKTRRSSEARQRQNARTSREACEELMAANFDRGDLFVTFTYRDAPPTREAALRRFNAFLRLLRQARAARGDRVLYIKCTEHIRDDGRDRKSVV